MKNICIFFVIVLITFSSCTTLNYYQVYKAQPLDEVTKKGDALVYEDDNVIISYDLFDEGGNIGFKIQNRTNNDIYLHLDKSYFILNGFANRYYQNRVFSNTSNKSTALSRSINFSRALTGINYLNLIQSNRISATSSTSVVSSSGFGIAYTEESIICIPKLTSELIQEFSISQGLYRDCDLLKYPSGKIQNPKTFRESDSPLKFSNRIVYSIGETGDPIEFENKFFVSEIVNYNDKQMFTSTNETFCEQKNPIISKIHKHYSPEKFYIKYLKGTDAMKH